MRATPAAIRPACSADMEVDVLKRFSIFHKLIICVAILSVIVLALSISGIRGVSSYRTLVRTVSDRAAELPKADDLIRSVNDLRFTFAQVGQANEIGLPTNYVTVDGRETFRSAFAAVEDALHSYQQMLDRVEPDGTGIGDKRDEHVTVREIELTLDQIARVQAASDWVLDQVHRDELREQLDELYRLSNRLPSHLQNRMVQLKGNVRGEYHALIGLTWTTSVLSTVMLGVLVKLLYDWVFQPLRTLIRGSRRVARGDFQHRITLTSKDEMAELAEAMNAMTMRFQEIRDDLDRQVKQRTKEVVRSEQMASVGFLAAGVAHEINNPLASIAWCAESLEFRLHDILYDEESQPGADANPEIEVLRNYLRRIQDEAFRCKNITEKLLDFSRMGDVQRHDTDLRELTEDVIDMVKTLGRYRNKAIGFRCTERVVACVNAQEIKQVILNLITNALDSLDPEGQVEVELFRQGDRAGLRVRDNGCGMTPEVLEHLFEPFFTRRRNGQGTGLGLSISFRIVEGHGGSIEASSAGAGAGSEFQVWLPLVQHKEHHDQQAKVA